MSMGGLRRDLSVTMRLRSWPGRRVLGLLMGLGIRGRMYCGLVSWGGSRNGPRGEDTYRRSGGEVFGVFDMVGRELDGAGVEG